MSLTLLGSIQVARGTTSERTAVTLLVGEICFDTTLATAFIGDGTTAGGIPIAAAGAAVWGTITGTLSSQTDLYNSLGFAGINVQTGTTYTLVAGDQNKLVQISNASSITLTIPPNSSVAFPTNTTIYWQQYGAGLITVAPGAGVTIRSPNGLTSNSQYSVRAMIKIGTNEWVIP